MNKHTIFFGSIVFLVTMLGGFVFLQERIITGGDEVILATVPIDPRDLLRGEYVILRYEIETAPIVRENVTSEDASKAGYVRLEADENGIAQVVEFRQQKPDLSSGIWLKGEVNRNRIRFPNLEQYFVPEGAGTPIERLRSEVHVEVRVLKGEARVVRLLDAELQPIDAYEYRE